MGSFNDRQSSGHEPCWEGISATTSAVQDSSTNAFSRALICQPCYKEDAKAKEASTKTHSEIFVDTGRTSGVNINFFPHLFSQIKVLMDKEKSRMKVLGHIFTAFAASDHQVP